MKTSAALLLIVPLLAVVPVAAAQAPVAPRADAGTPYDFVDPFIGTGGEGHTYPGASVPFGMVQLSPDTEIRDFRQSFPWAAGYRYSDSTILGFSHTHFSGTGHSDLGDVLLMPTVGPLRLAPGTAGEPATGYRSRFSHAQERARPGYYSVALLDPGVAVELSATDRVGMHRYTFPASDEAHVILDLVSSIYNYDGKVLWSKLRVESDTLVTGFRETKGWSPGRQVYFALEFSRPFVSYGLVNEAEETYKGFGRRESRLFDYPEISGRKLKAHFNFQTRAGEVILAKVALSSVGIDGALRNLRAEVPGWDFEAVRAAARDAWSRELAKLRVEGETRQRTIFYTALYHTMLAPVTYMDVDGRYRGADGAIHSADPEGISGNEDCGQMSAWYVFGALGFYPVTPGSLEYVIGAPQLAKAVLELGGGKTFSVEAAGLSERNLYIQSAMLDGKPYDKAFLRHQDITKGGTLRFVMGPRPKRSWASAATSAPYSMSDRRH